MYQEHVECIPAGAGPSSSKVSLNCRAAARDERRPPLSHSVAPAFHLDYSSWPTTIVGGSAVVLLWVIFGHFVGDKVSCPIEATAYDLERKVGDLATQLFGSDGMSHG